MEKLPVRNPEFPQASIIRRVKDKAKNVFPSSILSSMPKNNIYEIIFFKQLRDFLLISMAKVSLKIRQ